MERDSSERFIFTLALLPKRKLERVQIVINDLRLLLTHFVLFYDCRTFQDVGLPL